MKKPAPRLSALLIGLLALGSMCLAQLAAPELVRACSCAQTSVAKFAGIPDYTIVFGVVQRIDTREDGTQSGNMRVERVFQGDIAAAVLPVSASGLCMDSLSQGMQLVAVGAMDAGTFRPNLCGPMGDLRDPSGQDVMADVRASLGNGWAPGEQAPARPPGTGDGLAVVAMAALGLAGGLFAVILVLGSVRHRERRGGPAS